MLARAYFIRFSDFPIWEDAALAHSPACPNWDELGLLSFRGNPWKDATLARGLPAGNGETPHYRPDEETGLRFSKWGNSPL